MLPTPLLQPTFSTLIRHVHPEIPDRPYSGDEPADLEFQKYKSPYQGLLVKSHVDPRCVAYNAGEKLHQCSTKDINSLAQVISPTLGLSPLESRTYLRDLQDIYIQWTKVTQPIGCGRFNPLTHPRGAAAAHRPNASQILTMRSLKPSARATYLNI